ncbi:uncharacterized protein FOKN1_2820 [Thiohalobacter thiocyanaticus]|uniref:Type II toxin-antitoxin system HicB family antitoxin n=1 Tax=Thiohalobacter thiocyanaticus TaxID=585455 RepID=A0A1Z4VU62_9GAMM|nr:type II toxin-antitoxin system HicB family antitoxin [Thiohalobacter thiocyanaticus]BAZ95180.1 uncharacterized protein FOKN1_2820 [Thiohalobacter thiocyanaticus]
MAKSQLQFAYPMLVTEDDAGRLLARFPDFPEALTDAPDLETLLEEATDCLDEAVAARIAEGMPLPHPAQAVKGRVHWIMLPAQTAAKAALYAALRDSGLSKSGLARRLGCDEKEVRRMLDPRHATRLPRIEAALDALGKRLIVHTEDVA